jgi:hypothetical protein
VNFGIAVDLLRAGNGGRLVLIVIVSRENLTRCAGDEEPSFGTLGEAQHVECAHEGSLEGLDGVELIVWR